MQPEFSIAKAAESWPERPAILAPEGDLSYLQLYHAIRRAAGGLGISPGENIALLGPLTRDWLVTLLAIIEAGGVVCPVSTRWPESQIAEALKSIGCDRLLEPPYPTGDLVSLPIPAMDTPATIVFTSGSTGSPKAVVHSLSNHLFSAMGVNRAVGLTERDRWLLALPPYHVGGLAIIFRCLVAGAAIVLPGEEWRHDLVGERITHVSLVPTQLQRLLASPPEQHQLRSILVGGSEVSPALLRIARKLGLPCRTSYACSEMGSTICLSGILDDNLQILPHRHIRIDDNDEILVTGEPLFQGYLDTSGCHPQTDADGWYHTGDTGHLDAHHHLHVTGRLDNMFISGGENIHPETIERHLCALPDVVAAVVVPVPHAEFGYRPFAFVQAEPLDRDRLRSGLEHVLPHFMLPVRIEPLPPQQGLKPDRQALRELAENAL